MVTLKVVKWYRILIEQGRIHGHQLRTGGQGRKFAFSQLDHYRRTNRRTEKTSYRVACPQLKTKSDSIINTSAKKFLKMCLRIFCNGCGFFSLPNAKAGGDDESSEGGIKKEMLEVELDERRIKGINEERIYLMRS